MVVRLNEHEGKDGYESAVELLRAGVSQVSLVWRHPSGIWMKGRPDIVDFERRIVTDLKTAKDVRPAGFAKAISDYDYHWQAYLYLTMLEQLTGTTGWTAKYITVRNEPVHSVEIYDLTHTALLQAEAEVRLYLT